MSQYVWVTYFDWTANEVYFIAQNKRTSKSVVHCFPCDLFSLEFGLLFNTQHISKVNISRQLTGVWNSSTMHCHTEPNFHSLLGSHRNIAQLFRYWQDSLPVHIRRIWSGTRPLIGQQRIKDYRQSDTRDIASWFWNCNGRWSSFISLSAFKQSSAIVPVFISKVKLFCEFIPNTTKLSNTLATWLRLIIEELLA